MAAPVVTDRVTGQQNGVPLDAFTFPAYSPGDLVAIFFSDGVGTLFISEESNHGLWSMFRQNRFTSSSQGVIFKFMEGTEGSSLVVNFTSPGASKSYIAVTISGADPYRGFDKQTNIGSNDFDAEWNTGTSIDPPSLSHPFLSLEELLWFALGTADAVTAGAEADITAGPTADFADVDYYLPAGVAPAQPRAVYRMYAERTSDDASWDPAAWSIVNSERNAAWTLALPGAREHQHPDLIKTEYLKTGTMAAPQTVPVAVPPTTDGLLVFYVCGGAGSTLVLDPGGLAIVPSLGPSEPGAVGATDGAQMFYCEAPAAGTYDLQVTKVGTSNNARIVVVKTFNNVEEVVDWGSVSSSAASHTVNLATEEDHLAVAGLSASAGGSGEDGLTASLFDVEIDGVPMAPKASAMTLTSDVTSGATTTIMCRSFVGRTGGSTQAFVAHHLGRTPAARKLLVLYLRGLDNMNAPWWGTEF